MAIAVLLLSPIALWRGIKGKSTGLELPLLGLLVGGGFACYANSFLLTDVVRALILFYMTPIWTTIFEILFLKKQPRWYRAVSLTLALAGLWIVFGQEKIIPLPQNAGDWVALIGGAIFAGGAIRLEVVKSEGIFPIVFAFFFYGGLATLAQVFFLTGELGPMPSVEALLSMATWLILLSVLYFIPTAYIILWSPRHIGAGLFSILILSEIIIGIVSASLFANEPFGWREGVGGSLIFLAGLAEIVLTPKNQHSS
jgi:drug/metabolite transporter (DMT)-like permease